MVLMFDDEQSETESELNNSDTSPLRGLSGIKKLSSLNNSERRNSVEDENNIDLKKLK